MPILWTGKSKAVRHSRLEKHKLLLVYKFQSQKFVFPLPKSLILQAANSEFQMLTEASLRIIHQHFYSCLFVMQKGQNRNFINEQKQLKNPYWGFLWQGKYFYYITKKSISLSEHMRGATNYRFPMMYYEEHKACKIQSLLSLSSTPPELNFSMGPFGLMYCCADV